MQKNIIQELAEVHNTSEEEIKQIIQELMDIAYNKLINSPLVMPMKDGVIPTQEEFINYIIGVIMEKIGH